MKNKGFYFILVLLLIFVAGFLFWKPKDSTVRNTKEDSNKVSLAQDTTVKTNTLQDSATTSQETNTQTKNSSSKSIPSNVDETQAVYSGESDIESPDVAVFEVDYDGTSFSPKSITIHQGDIVVFKNQGSKDFWPASNNHPLHTLYPEFDSKKAIAAGGKYEFKFSKVGTWGYHDHKNPNVTGTVIVE